jgi:hypothetical protein
MALKGKRNILDIRKARLWKVYADEIHYEGSSHAEYASPMGGNFDSGLCQLLFLVSRNTNAKVN